MRPFADRLPTSAFGQGQGLSGRLTMGAKLPFGKKKSANARNLLLNQFGSILAPYRHGTTSPPLRDQWHRSAGASNDYNAASLQLHEFATNAAKHGSLSAAAGSIEIACSSRDGKAIVNWCEVGGSPPVPTMTKVSAAA